MSIVCYVFGLGFLYVPLSRVMLKHVAGMAIIAGNHRGGEILQWDEATPCKS